MIEMSIAYHLDCAFDAHAACNVHDAAMDLFIGLLASQQSKKRS